MEVLRDGSFMLNLPAEMLARGLRPSAKMARDKEYLVKCAGAVGYDNVLQVIEDLELKRIATDIAITDSFPYPQIFVCKEVIIVCGLTAIYEYHSLTAKLINIPPGLTWTCIDYGKFIYLSNCTVAVIRDAMSGVYHYADDYPNEDYRPCRAGCDNNGQAVISPCPLYVAPVTTLLPTSLPPTSLSPTTIVQTTLTPTTIPQELLLPWGSCPQMAIWSGTDPWFITSDDGVPVDNLFIKKYTGGVWSDIYNLALPNDPDILGYTAEWTEPYSSVTNRGTITVVVLVRPDVGGSPWLYDVFTFNGETLLNRVSLSSVGLYKLRLRVGHYVHIDSLGVIHIIGRYYQGNPVFRSRVYDYQSSDNGASFTPVLVAGDFVDSPMDLPVHIFEDGSGNLWVFAYYSMYYKSINNGATWSLVTPSTALSGPGDIKYLNDAFFEIGRDATDAILRRSINDCVDWTTVLTVGSGQGSILTSTVLLHDGTYYYAIFNLRDEPLGTRTGTNYVYRSSDGTTWGLVASIQEPCEQSGTIVSTAQLSVNSVGTLLYTHYYASTLLSGHADVYMLCVWTSDDNGVTWTNIQTPFYDLTTGVAP